MVIPISGFLPVPLPMMIPFMGAQSLVIGKMFGEGFQYGKRKISAMPNEEFNQLTFEKMMSNAREEIKASVPTMNAAMQDMKPMVDIVVREFLQYINEISKTLQELTVTGVDELAHLVGGHIHGETEPTLQPQPTPTPTNPQLPFSPENPTPFTPTSTFNKDKRVQVNIRIAKLDGTYSWKVFTGMLSWNELNNLKVSYQKAILRPPLNQNGKRTYTSTQKAKLENSILMVQNVMDKIKSGKL